MSVTRSEMWESVGGTVDLLVIGGGITGCGVARDAARRGLRVVLCEMNDFAYGTSSRSSKLVHGGLRYLEHYEFSLVFEAVSERRILLDIAPHLVNPLGFLFPVFNNSARKLWFISAGMWLYDGLSLFRSPKLHRTLKPADIRAEEPALNTANITGAPLYYDCSTDDARLTLENAIDAARAGATVATWAKVRSFVKDEQSRVVGAMIEDQITGELKEVRAHSVVNCTGPWTDRTVSMSKALTTGPLLRPTKGVHIVVDSKKLPLNHAVVVQHPKDKRVLFGIPWGDRTYIGTTDTDYDGDPADVAATSEDIDYLIDASLAYFPDFPLKRGDVIATWAGLRPLMAPVGQGGDVNESSVSREHQIIIGSDGLITIAGGKLTTYRRMSAEVVDSALKMLRISNQMPDGLKASDTDQEPLPGAVGWPEDDDHDAVAAKVLETSQGVLSEAQARHLANTYGMRGLDLARRVAKDPSLATPLVPGRPEMMVQVDWACEEEMAARLIDVMVRRTQLFYRDHDQGLTAAPAVAARMAIQLGWDEVRVADERARYEAEVALSRAWKAAQ